MVEAVGEAKLKHVLPRLVTAYEQGMLVPFTGAGTSYNACPLWDDFVQNLERLALQYTGPQPDAAMNTNGDADKIRRANDAVRTLKNHAPEAFAQHIRTALQIVKADAATSEFISPQTTPALTTTLAKVWWPLLLTTNYDDWFYHAYTGHNAEASGKDKRPLEVVGRGPQDCQKVLYSLEASRDSILWALQGFVGGQHPEGQKLSPDTTPWEKRLEEELVVGHQEYRRVTNNAQHFRRAFAQVFRNRSLLFVGTSLSEDYFLNLFGEVLETYGPNLVPHYAFVRKGDVDAKFMQERFGMIVVEFAEHAHINAALDEFAQRVNGAHSRVMRWDYSLKCEKQLGAAEDCTHFQVIRGRLPRLAKSETGAEAVAISAGGSVQDPWPGEVMWEHIKAMTGRAVTGYVSNKDLEAPASLKFVRHYKDAPVFLVVARAEGDHRDARTIARAVEELMQQAQQKKYTRIHCQLLAAGPGSDLPPRTALIEMTRGYAAWYRRQDADCARLPVLAIHLVAPDVLFDVATQRINILELLTAQDTRFWVQIVRDVDEPERFLMEMPGNTLVSSLLTRFHIPLKGWFTDVTPAPIKFPESLPTEDIAHAAGCTLDALGVFPGSVLSFSRTGKMAKGERALARHRIR